MSLPQMLNPVPIVIPAVTSQTFDSLFLYTLLMQPTTDTDGSFTQNVQMQFRGYNYSTSQFAPQNNPDGSPVPLIQFNISDLYVDMARVPLLAQAMEQVVMIAPLLYQESILNQQIVAATTAGTDTTALQAQLATVQAAMGISQ